MDPYVFIARTVQIAAFFFAVYVAGLAIKRIPVVTHLRFRADHIYYAIVLIFFLTFVLIYLCAVSLTVPLQYHWWVTTFDKIMQLALFTGILNCVCGCTSGVENHAIRNFRNNP